MNKAIVIVTVSIVAVLVLLPFVARAIRGNAPVSPTSEPQSAFTDQETTQQAQPVASAPQAMPNDGTPAIVSMIPENGAANVSSQVTQLTVRFNVPMRGGFSWTGGGPEFPETTGKPYWAADQQTCVLPVRLKPNWSYRVGLNSPSHRNFKSANGIPLSPVVWRFNTGAN